MSITVKFDSHKVYRDHRLFISNKLSQRILSSEERVETQRERQVRRALRDSVSTVKGKVGRQTRLRIQEKGGKKGRGKEGRGKERRREGEMKKIV